jgi:hypothetical protein
MVATRAQIASVAAVRPAARLDRLPVDLLAHIALYTGYNDETGCNGGDDKGDLLALRCACRACEPAVRRAALDHELLTHCYFSDSGRWHVDTQALAAYGKVLGSGCRNLETSTTDEGSPEFPDALRGFVAHTQGRLRELNISVESFRADRAFVLELCGACPQLTELRARWNDADGATSASIDGFCKVLSRLCPLLEDVELRTRDMSFSDPSFFSYKTLFGVTPAESYQMHFPATKTLNFYVSEAYVPTRWDRIAATLEACVNVKTINLSCCTVSSALVDVLLRAPLKSRLKELDLSYETTVSTETVLRCAAGFEVLSDLRLPEYWSVEEEWYRSLARARPTITALNLGFRCLADDACLQMIAESLSLERLEITLMQNLTPAAIDIIVDSPSGQTLRYFNDYETPIITAATLLRLVRGCPLLNELEWSWNERPSPIEDGATIDAINELLRRRGGKDLDPFVEYGPSQYGRPEPRESDEESDEESESGED